MAITTRAVRRQQTTKSFKPLTRKTRYSFLKNRVKFKYKSRDVRRTHATRRYKRLIALEMLRAQSNKKRKKNIIFTFRKGTFPNRASFEPILKPIYDRHKIITEDYLNKVVSVYNGIMFFNYKIPVEAIGYKFGEISPTKQWKPGATHVKRKKSKKKSDKGSKKPQKSASAKTSTKKTQKK